MIRHTEIDNKSLISKIRRGEIWFGGNRVLKIYGKLSCASGKRMKKENRVFFNSKEEALHAGFRPCGHCMKDEYLLSISRQAK
jgi:methylphosphotriester-DNA--protein-cysteine methyltransferase